MIEISQTNLTRAAYCKMCGETFKGDKLLLSVTDDGKGIDDDVLPHIFEPFYTTKAVGEGTTFSIYFPSNPSSFMVCLPTTKFDQTGK